ncbi:putative toxin-antitoxin system toxin component, PIN family [Chloroflexi bacterium TSY]|nr:putative toxin-antitoxin system toxin component, PIN family [Chloroflexi bacterium TSY]
MLRIVLDTDVIVSAMRSPSGASAAILNEADAHRVQLLVSVALVLEYEAKCTLIEHYQAAGITQADACNFVDAITVLSEPTKQHFFWRPQLRDPADEMVLETAINGRANMIVTFNLRDYGQVPQQFGIEVIRPAEAIWRIRS